MAVPRRVTGHSCSDRRTPQQTYDARIKARPSGYEDGVHYRIRFDKIDKTGSVTIRYGSKLHHIGVGRKHKNTPVIMLVADRNIRIVNLRTGELLRKLVLDPDRDYQPQRPA